MYRIDDVIVSYWNHLVAGETLTFDGRAIEDPATRPDIFKVVDGWPKGQTADYGWSQTRGRVHAQHFWQDGVKLIKIHFDQHDPNSSVDEFVNHAVKETPVRDILAVAAMFAAIVFVGAGIAAIAGDA
jgi:hypothetical protein